MLYFLPLFTGSLVNGSIYSFKLICSYAISSYFFLRYQHSIPCAKIVYCYTCISNLHVRELLPLRYYTNAEFRWYSKYNHLNEVYTDYFTLSKTLKLPINLLLFHVPYFNYWCQNSTCCLYFEGDIPFSFLNILEKPRVSSYPTEREISPMVNP